MAYAAVISLKQTIHSLLTSPRILNLPTCREILESAYKDVSSLQEILQRLQSRISDSSSIISKGAVTTLNGGIREAVCKLEDALEFHVLSDQFLSRSDGSLEDALEKEIEQEIDSFKETVKKLEEEYDEYVESSKSLPDEEDDVVFSSRSIDFGGAKSMNMVGLMDEFSKIKDKLTATIESLASSLDIPIPDFLEFIEELLPYSLQMISLLGMAGIGKTTIARKIFEDESVRSCFNRCAFVTVGPKYQMKEIMVTILSQMNLHMHEGCMTPEEVGAALHQHLKEMKYLIVLDDVWDKSCWDQLREYLPDDKKGSRILVTTRLEKVAENAEPSDVQRIRFLDKEESLCLLREKVFGEDQLFPDYQLEKAAEKIVENCEGLPLAIIAVADLLSKADKTPEYWKEVAEKGHLVFKDVSDDLSRVLLSSYNYLPQPLKACFLYMGAFPPKCEIPTAKLTRLWSVEGFLEPDPPQENLENFARTCLEDLASNSLILVRKHTSISGTKIRTCSLHSIYWHLCNKEAGKEKFLHVLDSYADSLVEGTRRLCIHNNVLFGIEEVHDSMKFISTARSLLCTGPHHQYPLPMLCSQWKLLRVLDALSIRFYIFPIEVLELVQLRYLALTYSGKIPGFISKLRLLEYLIVQQHLRIISSSSPYYLPIEIWNMQELRCLQVMGSSLPYHDHGTALSLPNLLTLSYMSTDSCTREILEKTPNLKKLGIQIELAPDIAAGRHPLHCFDHLSLLHQLESLKCVIVNPNPTSQVVAFAASFPASLRKLSLSGLGYPWEYMKTIAQLRNLQVIKLQQYAFQGPKWETGGYNFPKLEFLLIEDTDLEYWITDFSCFSWLQRMVISHCYKLKEIPTEMLRHKTLELVHCPLAEASLENIQEENGFKLVSNLSGMRIPEPELYLG